MRIGSSVSLGIVLALSTCVIASTATIKQSPCYTANCVSTTTLRLCYKCCQDKCGNTAEETLDCRDDCKVKDHAYTLLGDDQTAIANFLTDFSYAGSVPDLDYCFLVGNDDNADLAVIVAGDVYQAAYPTLSPIDRDWLRTIVVGAIADPRSPAIRSAGAAAWRQAMPQDINQDGSVNVTDIFAFLRCWFAKSGDGDFDRNGSCSVTDIFAFLRGWFRGCVPAPLPVIYNSN